jgi:hypothetical protein
MREFEASFDKGFSQGLRSEAIEPVDNQRLVTLKNLRPHEFGLRPIVEMTNPFSATFAYPYPQMFLLRELRLMALETAIYTCDSSWSPTVAISSLTTGGLWQVADFGDFLLMTNGSQIVQRAYNGVWSKFTDTSSIPAMRTMCNFRGQIIGGNIYDNWEDCDVNYVTWSDIGSAEFYPGLKNEAGYAPMSWNGAVLRVMALGDLVAVYGVNGVSLLKPAKQYMAIKELDLPGIPTAGAVGGSNRGHVFVDYGGDVWMIGPEGKPKNLGYSEYISKMDASELVVSYNQHQNEYYISDDSTCYILGKNGLCQTHQIVSSCAFDNGVLYGTYESDKDISGVAVTDTLDFGQRALKTLTAMSAGCSSKNNMWTSVYWRSDVMGSFQQSEWQWINPTGFTTPMITAVDFKLAFRAENHSDCKLSNIKSRLKLSDKRMIRGIHSAA